MKDEIADKQSNLSRVACLPFIRGVYEPVISRKVEIVRFGVKNQNNSYQ